MAAKGEALNSEALNRPPPIPLAAVPADPGCPVCAPSVLLRRLLKVWVGLFPE